MNDELEGLLDEMDEFIRRAIDAETTSQTIEMLSGMTIEQVVDGFRDGKFDPRHELEVLSQEWIDKNKTSIDRKLDGTPIYKVREELLQNLLVPKQELPVIPKHVGEWITRYREKYDLYPALRTLEYNTSTWEQVYKWYRENTHKFVNAYLTGEYEVEEEPMYYALIKGHELIDAGRVYWDYDKSDDSVFISELYSLPDNFLTEMSKEDWNKLGINDSNADFVRVDG